MSLHRSIAHAGLWMMLGLALASAPALAGNRSQCQADCTAEPSSEMEACLHTCPPARKNAKASGFETCAHRCKARFDAATKGCKVRCNGQK